MHFRCKRRKSHVRRCLEFIWSGVSSTSNFMIVSSETLTRLSKRTCSPVPSLMTYVVSTSRLFTKYPGTSSYGAPRKLISCSGSIGNKIKQSIFLSLHGSVFDFCKDPTEYLRRIGDIGVKSASARRTFVKQILMLFKTCDVNAGFTLAT